MNSADNGPSSRRLDEIEYDIVETRAALGRTLEELAHQLMPSPAHRLVQTGLDVAAGALGETGLTEGREFVRANPIAAALIDCGAVLSLLGRFGGGDIEAADAERASAGSAGRTSGSDGLRATISRHPALLAAIGLGAGALVATLLAAARKAADDDGSAGTRSEAPEPDRVPPPRRFVHPAEQDGLIRAY